MFNIGDLEYALIFIILGILLCFSLHKRENANKLNRGGYLSLVISKEMSTIVKAFCCVFILMGHFAARDIQSGIATYLDKAVYMTTANFALVIFMFFSGYGLSFKKKPTFNIGSVLFSRIKKVYLPLLYICLIYVIMCYLLPDVYDSEIVTQRELPTLIHEFSDFNRDSLQLLAKSLLGYNDWYVVCIIYFYTLFYLSQWISNKTTWNFTIVLAVLLLVYYVVAYHIYGMPQAHFFRFPCAFMLGHLVAKYERCNITKREKLVDAIILLLYILTVSFHGLLWLCIYAVAISMLLFFSLVDKVYEVKSKSLLLTLGTVSYFYYLSHGRICYTLMYYIGIDDLLFWTIFTGIVSYVLWYVYEFLKCRDCILGRCAHR